jgi:alpha-tubulin suppressor-like RCC1 family protein
VYGGNNFSYAYKADGTLWGWGASAFLGGGFNDYAPMTSPVKVFEAGAWQSLSPGQMYALAIKPDGTLWAWGWNVNGRMGVGANDGAYFSPVQVGEDSDWVYVRAGLYHSFGIKADGSHWGGGANNAGNRGMGSTTPGNYYAPTRIGTANDWAVATTGQTHSIALKTDGSLWGWGHSVGGEVGDGVGNDVIYPSPIRIGNDSDWASVEPHQFVSSAFKSDGSLWWWGMNTYGFTGTGLPWHEPIWVPTVNPDHDFVAVAPSRGGYTSLAMKADGSLWVCGVNFFGALGLGLEPLNYTVYLTVWTKLGDGFRVPAR